MPNRLHKGLFAFALASVLIVGTLGVTGESLTNDKAVIVPEVSALVDQRVGLLSHDTLQTIAKANAVSLGMSADATRSNGDIIVSLGQWLTLTQSGVNLELLQVTRSSPVYIVEYSGSVDGRKLDSDFKYDRIIVAIRADTGASMGYVAIPAGLPGIGEISVNMPDTFVERIPPSPIPPPALGVPDTAEG